MFAILGLFSFALASVMLAGHEDVAVTDTDIADDDVLADHCDGILPVVPLDDFVPANNITLPDNGLPYFAGDNDDHVTGNDADNYIHGEDGNDQIFGEIGNDELHGGRGGDALFGGADDDSLFGHVGDDRLFGGDGNDQIIGGDGHDLLDGGDGHDSLLGYLGDDTLIGGPGADVLFGGFGDDLVIGDDDATADFLNGGDGDDVLRAGLHDHLNGGNGADVFSIDANAGAMVDDFDPTQDVIEVTYRGTQPALSTLTTQTGLTLLADGQSVANFVGVKTLDLNAVLLITA